MTQEKSDGKPLVVVVEDEPLIRFAATEYLHAAGWRTLEAENAQEGKHLVKEHPEAQVLFTDVNLPGSMDGLELATLVHRDHPNIELVVTSGRHRFSDEELPDDGTFLPKPYLEADLIRVINQKLH
jgi:CheY-like chemotaxis protein